MYNRDKSILYYYSNSYKDLYNYFNIHLATFKKHLEKGTYYLGKYLFTDEFEPSANDKQMTHTEVSSMLDNDRKKFKRKK
jgi:pyrroloquinoline quinone (PQQ) biosynthesis protein C